MREILFLRKFNWQELPNFMHGRGGFYVGTLIQKQFLLSLVLALAPQKNEPFEFSNFVIILMEACIIHKCSDTICLGE